MTAHIPPDQAHSVMRTYHWWRKCGLIPVEAMRLAQRCAGMKPE